MVLAYNRSAANEIRRRLWALVDADAAGVTVQTLHGLAMRLTGTNYAVAIERGEQLDFDAVIRRATRQLTAAGQARRGRRSERRHLHRARPPACGPALPAGRRYQDINGEHYELICAVAGRTLQTEEDRVSLMVVGDGDQNIYAFGGASVRYIRQFRSHCTARRCALVENYRSTRHHPLRQPHHRPAPGQRMKVGQEIRINHARRDHPAAAGA